MNLTTIVVAVVVIVAIGLVLMAVMARRGGRMRPLPEGALERYAGTWRAIEARFIESPGEAVREADTLVTTLSRERGVPAEKLERPMTPAVGGDDTEYLRRAMVHYRSTVERLLGTDPREVRTNRTEVA